MHPKILCATLTVPVFFCLVFQIHLFLQLCQRQKGTQLLGELLGSTPQSSVIEPINERDGQLKETEGLVFEGLDKQVPGGHLGIIDGMLQGKYPVLPVSSIVVPLPGSKYAAAQIRRVHWNALANGSVPRYYGKGLEPATPEMGGRTIRGQWPDKIRQLVLIVVRKNGSTSLGVAFDELSQRIGGLNDTGFVPDSYIPNYIEKELVPNRNSTLVFTVLRDPIDRFLSSTCQDLYTNPISCAKKSNINAILACIMEMIEKEKFMPHQIQQHAVLYRALGNYQDGTVTVLPFSILNKLKEEMGVTDETQFRDRKSYSYENRNPRATELCHMKARDLRPEHLDVICSVYKADVEMVRATGQKVALCDGRL